MKKSLLNVHLLGLFCAGALSLHAGAKAQISNGPCMKPGVEQCPDISLLPAYNAPISKTACGWDAYASGSFVYWQAIQDDMELAQTVVLSPAVNFESAVSTIPIISNRFSFSYNPGFKLIVGGYCDYDNWDLFAEYTWYHTGDMTSSVSAPGVPTVAVTPGFPLPTATAFTDNMLISRIQAPAIFGSSVNLGNYYSRTWNLKMDFLDLMLARSYVVGTKLNFRPSFGARGAWIRQETDEFQNSTTPYFVLNEFVTNSTLSSQNKSVSWAYGLKAAMNADWVFGCGFSMFGCAGIDLLYSHYNMSNYSSATGAVENPLTVPPTATVLTHNVPIKEKGLYAVRPHTELEIGFAYGTNFDCCRRYVEVSASYGFQVFWDQNMFLESNNAPLPANDLYLQGMRLTASVLF